MKAFLLAAGFGERLQPITDTMPKPLVPVVNIPIICYSLGLLKEAGITQVVCNLHYRHEDIISFFKKHNNFGMDITFSIEDTILGTGGGVKLCESYLAGDSFILINSDIIVDLSLGSLLEKYSKDKRSRSSIVVRSINETGKKGTIAVDDSEVVDIKGFLATGINHEYDYTGVALLSPDVFDYLPKDFSSIVDTAYCELAKLGKLQCHVCSGLWEDIGTIEGYRKANILLKDKKDLLSRIGNNTGLTPKDISTSAIIDKKVKVKNSIIGDECFIESGASILNSVLMPGAKVKSGMQVRDSIILKES